MRSALERSSRASSPCPIVKRHWFKSLCTRAGTGAGKAVAVAVTAAVGCLPALHACRRCDAVARLPTCLRALQRIGELVLRCVGTGSQQWC